MTETGGQPPVSFPVKDVAGLLFLLRRLTRRGRNAACGHGETPHYHRRYGVSLLSSAWGQVGPPRYGRQANSVLLTRLSPVNLICIRLKIFSHPPKQLRRCKVKPHGSLVPVSSTHRCAAAARIIPAGAGALRCSPPCSGSVRSGFREYNQTAVRLFCPEPAFEVQGVLAGW